MMMPAKARIMSPMATYLPMSCLSITLLVQHNISFFSSFHEITKRMNKGIILVLVLLLLVGTVIAGIVITSKSKYTKGSVGAPLADTNSCALNYACRNSVLEGGCQGTPQCENTSTTSYQLDGSLQLPGGPRITDCICSGHGKCDGSNNCTCNAGTNLDPKQDCSLCNPGYTWDGTKCVQLNPCKNGGTLGTDGKCVCPTGYSPESDCQCGAETPEITTTVNAGDGCETLLVCPYGEGTSLEFDTTWEDGGCYWSGQASRTEKRNAIINGKIYDGCYEIPQAHFFDAYGPNCQFISTSKIGTETVNVSQDGCVTNYGTIEVTGASNHKKKDGGFPNESGQILIGPKLC
jgi:hypothetical protein